MNMARAGAATEVGDRDRGADDEEDGDGAAAEVNGGQTGKGS